MVYHELEQGDTLSEVRVGVAPLAYTDILLRSIWAIFKIRQTPVHIPAIIVHGDTLRLQNYSVWRTFAHVMGFWDSKLARDPRRLPAETLEPVNDLSPQLTAPLPPVGTQLSLL